MKKYAKILSITLGVLGIGCIATFGALQAYKQLDRREMDRELDPYRPAEAVTAAPDDSEAEDVSELAEPIPELQPTASPTPEPEPEPTEVPRVENPYRESFLKNADMAAWIRLEDSKIDYPVMWTPRDENYYLNRGFDGKDNKNGCLILDTDSCLDPLTTNQIIHGHNMRSGAMFGDLEMYEDPAYCESHKYFQLYTKECLRNYEVIAVFRSQVFRKTDEVFKFYKFFRADTAEEFDDFYNNIMAMSLYDTGVRAEFGDHFLTLSTCAYHVEMGRFVVVAKEIEPGEYYQPIED